MVCVCHIFISSYKCVMTSLVAQRSEPPERRSGISDRLLAELESGTLKWSYQHQYGLFSLRETDLAFEIGLGLNFPLLLETIHNILVSPTDLMR